MSDIGLYSGLYEQIREYAELVDDVLITLKGGTSSPGDASRQRLGNLLLHFADDHWDDLSAHRVALILKSSVGYDPRWLSVGNALLSATVDGADVELLENLARSLEEEQVGVTIKMREGIH